MTFSSWLCGDTWFSFDRKGMRHCDLYKVAWNGELSTCTQSHPPLAVWRWSSVAAERGKGRGSQCRMTGMFPTAYTAGQRRKHATDSLYTCREPRHQRQLTRPVTNKERTHLLMLTCTGKYCGNALCYCTHVHWWLAASYYCLLIVNVVLHEWWS